MSVVSFCTYATTTGVKACLQLRKPRSVAAAWCVLTLFASHGFGDVSTPKDREALFEYLITKTLEREAFSEIKNRKLGLDVEAAMRAYRDEVIQAETDQELFYALVKMSNARRDRHLRVNLVEGGLDVSKSYSLSANPNYPDLDAPPEDEAAALRFAVDYESERMFVSDFAANWLRHYGSPTPAVGDFLIRINGVAFRDYIRKIKPYFRFSTANGFWVAAADALPKRTPILPGEFYGNVLSVELEKADGYRYELALPYMRRDEIRWAIGRKREYPDFERLLEKTTFDLYRSTNGKPVLLISWKGFGESLVEDVDALMDYAEAHDYLGYHVIWDGTRSRGGRLGVYTVRHFSSKPFKVPAGNLRLSGVIPRFVKHRQRLAKGSVRGRRSAPKAFDDKGWLLDWLEMDVLPAYARGESHSNSVPFKLVHLPRDSDGWIRPAKRHFQGKMVCLFGPYGGSHLDQFAAIVVDNNLCHTIGMSTAGYSNTWEWKEIVRFPISRKRVVEFMWSIGQTIRPNGEVLEGNPAVVDDYVPVRRDNYAEYYDLVLQKAWQHLQMENTKGE